MITPFDLDLNPLQLFLRLPEDMKGVAYLASDGSYDARWSILAWNPSGISEHDFLSRLAFIPGTSEKYPSSPSTPTASLLMRDFAASAATKNGSEGYFSEVPLIHELPFLGGWIGTIDYEYSVRFARYDSALVFDHQKNQWYGVGGVDTEKIMLWSKGEGDVSERQELNLKPGWDFASYEKAFNQVKKYIREGEIYQACLTFPFSGKAVKHPRALFAQCLEKNPAQMGVYLEQAERTVMSLSPERFVLFDRGILETRPIKGTRPKGQSAEEKLFQQMDLISDKKETAELSMITDLLRNDMAQVSKPGTVKVIESQALQELPKIWHTYSLIRSETREGITHEDIIKALFPGGSITGCPKIRAMEILRELEPAPRGLYTGCIGYISDHGRMDLNIAIRTLTQEGDLIHTGFGGGIVADSEAKKEYEECFTKASSFSA